MWTFLREGIACSPVWLTSVRTWSFDILPIHDRHRLDVNSTIWLAPLVDWLLRSCGQCPSACRHHCITVQTCTLTSDARDRHLFHSMDSIGHSLAIVTFPLFMSLALFSMCAFLYASDLLGHFRFYNYTMCNAQAGINHLFLSRDCLCLRMRI